MTKPFTVFGGTGFVGSAVVQLLERNGHAVRRVARHTWPEPGAALGHVIFTIGMTADFRTRLVETMEMHVLRLHEALTRYSFDSFVYLSSARVYDGASSTHEDAALLVRPQHQDHVYNISKLAGESLCLAHQNPAIRVVRLSNVFGAADDSNLFLTAVMREAVETGAVTIGQSPLSSKDYIDVDTVAKALVDIATRGRHRIYNVASGENITHQTIADILSDAGYKVTFREGGQRVVIPPIDVSRLTQEFRLTEDISKPATDPQEAIRSVLKTIQNNRNTQ